MTATYSCVSQAAPPLKFARLRGLATHSGSYVTSQQLAGSQSQQEFRQQTLHPLSASWAEMDSMAKI